MFDLITDWLFALLPEKVQWGCLIAAAAAIAIVAAMIWFKFG